MGSSTSKKVHPAIVIHENRVTDREDPYDLRPIQDDKEDIEGPENTPKGMNDMNPGLLLDRDWMSYFIVELKTKALLDETKDILKDCSRESDRKRCRELIKKAVEQIKTTRINMVKRRPYWKGYFENQPILQNTVNVFACLDLTPYEALYSENSPDTLPL